MKRKINIIIITSALIMLAGCQNNSATAELDKDTTSLESILINESSDTSEITTIETTAILITEFTEFTENETTIETAVSSINEEMPEPFSHTGGDQNMNFYATANLKLGYTDGSFSDLVGWDEFKEWLYATSSSKSNYTSIDEVANLYSFIKYFDVPDEFIRLVEKNLELEGITRLILKTAT